MLCVKLVFVRRVFAGAIIGVLDSPTSPASAARAGIAEQPEGRAVAATAPTPPGPVLAALGFSSAEAFQSYVDALTPEELKVYLVLVVAVAHALE